MKLLNHVHEACVTEHCLQQTEEFHVRWIERFLRFHRAKAGKWIHLQDMTAGHVESFLTQLLNKMGLILGYAIGRSE